MKTTITVSSLSVPAAQLGPMNPLPDLKTVQYVHSGVTLGPHVTKEEAERIGYGMVQSILPYKIQDGYDRDRRLRSFRAVVLENDALAFQLRVTFAPDAMLSEATTQVQSDVKDYVEAHAGVPVQEVQVFVEAMGNGVAIRVE